MKAYHIFIFLLFTISIYCCDTKYDTFELYKFTVSDFSTSPYYTVIILKNKETNESKEICVTAGFVHELVQTMYNINYPEPGTDSRVYMKSIVEYSLSHKDRIFIVPNSIYISSYCSRYSMSDLIEYSNKTDMIAIKTCYINGTIHNIDYNQFIYGDIEERMFAHLCFNYGILTNSNSCISSDDTLAIVRIEELHN